MLFLLAFILFLAAIAIRFGLLVLSSFIILNNVTDILSNGWSFWPVFWILLAIGIALFPVHFKADSSKD